MATEQEKNRRVAEQLRLIDDDFLRLYFNDNPEGVEYILNILLERQDLKVLHSETQCEYRSLSGRSISLDIYAEDTNGKRYNIEIQRADSGATPKRARFHSSMLDTKLLQKKEPFRNLAETFVIMLTEHDIMKHGLPLYHYDRICRETGAYLEDDSHIIYVNGAYQNPNDSIGRLMHDFQCVNAKDMYAEELSERFRYFKETEGGMGEMCKVVEERAKEYAADALQKEKVADIRRMLDKQKYSHKEIAENLNVSLELVDEVASGKVAWNTALEIKV